MKGYNEYFNLEGLSSNFSSKLEKIDEKFKKKFSYWDGSLTFVEEWPLNKGVRFDFSGLTPSEISEIETEVTNNFDKFEFATTTGICYEE